MGISIRSTRQVLLLQRTLTNTCSKHFTNLVISPDPRFSFQVIVDGKRCLSSPCFISFWESFPPGDRLSTPQGNILRAFWEPVRQKAQRRAPCLVIKGGILGEGTLEGMPRLQQPCGRRRSCPPICLPPSCVTKESAAV